MIGFKEIYEYLSIIGIGQGDPFAAEAGLDREVSVPVTIYRERPQLTPNAVRKKKKTNQWQRSCHYRCARYHMLPRHHSGRRK